MLKNVVWAVRVGEAEIGDGDDTRVRHEFPPDGDAVWFIIRGIFGCDWSISFSARHLVALARWHHVGMLQWMARIRVTEVLA